MQLEDHKKWTQPHQQQSQSAAVYICFFFFSFCKEYKIMTLFSRFIDTTINTIKSWRSCSFGSSSPPLIYILEDLYISISGSQTTESVFWQLWKAIASFFQKLPNDKLEKFSIKFLQQANFSTCRTIYIHYIYRT